MKVIFLTFILGLFSFCQDPNKKNIEKKYFVERGILAKTLEILVNILKLGRLEAANNSFEIRKWGPFINDSFPVFMERIFMKKEN